MSTVTCIYCHVEVPRRAPRQVICGSRECLSTLKRDCDRRKRRENGVRPLTTKRCECCDSVIERAQPNQRVCSDLRCRRILKAETKRARERAARQALGVASEPVPAAALPNPEPVLPIPRDPRRVGRAPDDPAGFSRYVRSHWRERRTALAIGLMEIRRGE